LCYRTAYKSEANKEDKVDFKVELTDNICKSCYFDFVSNDKKEICPNCEKKRISN